MFGSLIPSWDSLQQWGQQGAVRQDSYQNLFGSRFMDQRSRISFHYPSLTNKDQTIVFLPFYENPTITETQAANYGTYDLIGRGSSLFSYLGSGSRKIKVSMHFTLPHLAMHDMGINRFMRVFYKASKKEEKELFSPEGARFNKGRGEINTSLALAVQEEYLNLRYPNDPVAGYLDSLVESPSTNKILSNVLKAGGIGEPNQHTKVVDTLLFFISLLRTSVVNNAENPMLGPPLLRLSFGTLYQAVPCICKSYNLSWEEEAGYHLETLTPRRLKVDLVLEEVRVGDFGTYVPGTFEKRDNLAGWESTISTATTDPLPIGSNVTTPGS